MKWGHRASGSNGRFHGAFKSRDEAITAGRREHGAPFEIACGTSPSPSEMVDADDVIERMGDAACDVAREAAEEYPDVSDEARAELQALLEAWAEKHALVNFWVAEEVEVIE